MTDQKPSYILSDDIVIHTKELTDAVAARADELGLNKEMKCRLWFISYDDPYFAKDFVECDDNRIEYLLSALDFDIKTYSGVEYTNSRDEGRYRPPYDDRFIGVVSNFERYTPKERDEMTSKPEDIQVLAEFVMGDWYEKNAHSEDND